MSPDIGTRSEKIYVISATGAGSIVTGTMDYTRITISNTDSAGGDVILISSARRFGKSTAMGMSVIAEAYVPPYEYDLSTINWMSLQKWRVGFTGNPSFNSKPKCNLKILGWVDRRDKQKRRMEAIRKKACTQ